jgi:hypothetical protein
MLGTKLCDGCWEMKRNGKYDATKAAHDDLVAALRLVKRQADADGNILIHNYASAALAKAGAL